MNTDLVNFSTAVIIPSTQALISGTIAGATALAAANLAGADAWPWAGLAAATTAGIMWFTNLRAWRAAVYGVELAMGADLDGDGIVGEPEIPEPATVRLELTDGPNTTIAQLPASPEQLRRLAAGVLAGGTLAEATWTGHGRPFSRGQFGQLRAELINRGLANWNSPGTPARGISLTRGGLAAMRQFATMQPGSPTGHR